MPSYSSFAHHRCCRGDLGTYAAAILPLVTMMLIVPLQDYQSAPLGLKKMHSFGLVPMRFAQKNLVFSRGDWREGRYWRALTYAFSHHDTSHLSNNVLGIIWTGSTMFMRTGSAFGFHAIFLSSAGLSAYLSTHYDELTLLRSISSILPHNPYPSYMRWLHGGYDLMTNSLATWATHFLSHYVQYRGASSGVFGLLGAASMVGLEDCWTLGGTLWTVLRHRIMISNGMWGELVRRVFSIGKYWRNGGMMKGMCRHSHAFPLFPTYIPRRLDLFHHFGHHATGVSYVQGRRK